jgi:DnaJ family protein C protein 3
MDAENYEAAISSLSQAKEHHAGAQQLDQLIHNAQLELRRSKTKDYYKVLGLSRDADEVQIKAAYRKMVKLHHPDKAHKLGITKEEAEKKMASVNEAYEVLSDPELKARFDRGDDPNDHEQQRQHPFQGSPFGGGNPFGGQPFGHSQGGQQFNFKFGGGGFQFG